MEEKQKYEHKSLATPCPKCGDKIWMNPKSYGCGGWKKGCKVTIWKNAFGHEVTPEEAEALLTGKEIGDYDFTFKSGKTGHGKLYYDMDEDKVKIHFPPKVEKTEETKTMEMPVAEPESTYNNVGFEMPNFETNPFGGESEGGEDDGYMFT